MNHHSESEQEPERDYTMMLMERKSGQLLLRQTSSLNNMHCNGEEDPCSTLNPLAVLHNYRSTTDLETGHADVVPETDSINEAASCAVNGPPLHTTLNFVKLNVGGRVYTTRMRHFASYPQSRLGKLMREVSRSKILHYCDAYHPGVKDPTLSSTSTPVPLYFFDYSGTNFEMILDLYRHGTLHVKDGTICPMVIRRDLEYWGIDEYLFDPCCSFRFQQGSEVCFKDIEEAEREERNAQKETDEDPFGSSPIERVRKFLWHMTEYPESSIFGKIMAILTVSIIMISTITFLLGLFLEDPAHFDEDGNYTDDNPIKQFLDIIDVVALCFFTLEYFIRLFSCPNVKPFILSLLNFADLLAILPFLISLLMYELQALNIIGKASKLLHLIRILRVFRIFKLVRHLASLQCLLMTLRQANKELGLLGVMAGIALLMFATMTYYAEREWSAWSFSESIWWTLMTLTTVGYDLKTPDTWLGKLTGGFCSVVGVFVLTLPVPIVLNSFNGYYKNRLIRKVVWVKRRKKLEERRKKFSLASHHSIPNGKGVQRGNNAAAQVL